MYINCCLFDGRSVISTNLNSTSNTSFNGTVSSSYGVSIQSVIASPGFVYSASSLESRIQKLVSSCT